MNAKAELIPAGQSSTDVAVRAREAHERLQGRMDGARYDWAELGIALFEARKMIEAGDIEANCPSICQPTCVSSRTCCQWESSTTPWHTP